MDDVVYAKQSRSLGGSALDTSPVESAWGEHNDKSIGGVSPRGKSQQGVRL